VAGDCWQETNRKKDGQQPERWLPTNKPQRFWRSEGGLRRACIAGPQTEAARPMMAETRKYQQ